MGRALLLIWKNQNGIHEHLLCIMIILNVSKGDVADQRSCPTTTQTLECCSHDLQAKEEKPEKREDDHGVDPIANRFWKVLQEPLKASHKRAWFG